MALFDEAPVETPATRSTSLPGRLTWGAPRRSWQPRSPHVSPHVSLTELREAPAGAIVDTLVAFKEEVKEELSRAAVDVQAAVREELELRLGAHAPGRRGSAEEALQSDLMQHQSKQLDHPVARNGEEYTQGREHAVLVNSQPTSSHAYSLPSLESSDFQNSQGPRPGVSGRRALGASRGMTPPQLGFKRSMAEDADGGGRGWWPMMNRGSHAGMDRMQRGWMTFIMEKMEEERSTSWDHVLSEQSVDSGAVPLVRIYAAWLLTGRGNWFDAIMGMVIVFNALCIGVEIQHSIDGAEWAPLSWLEHVFLAVYIVELVVRVLGNDGRCRWQGPYVKSSWFFLDVGLVTVGSVSAWVIQPVLLKASKGDSGASFDLIQQFLVLRVFRLLRLVRALRLIRSFQELWKLCRGLLISARTVIFACALVLITIYIFACLGVEFITNSARLQEDPVTAAIVETSFCSVLRTMLTLIAFANADSISAVYEPIVEAEPILAVFFGLVWLFVTVSLMNLVTAVIVDNAIAQTSQDHEFERTEKKRRLKELIPAIEQMFDDLDMQTGRQDGHVGLKEMRFENVRIPTSVKAVLNPEQLLDLFEFLDVDGSGTVDKEEFVERICTLALSGIPVETIQTLQLLRTQKKSTADLTRQMQTVMRTLRTVSHLDTRDGSGPEFRRDFSRTLSSRLQNPAPIRL